MARLIFRVNLLLSLLIIATTYGLACLLLAALVRVTDRLESDRRPM